MVGDKKCFLLQPVEFWKTPCWERTVSEHDIIQHTQITKSPLRNIFFFVYRKLGIWNRNK